MRWVTAGCCGGARRARQERHETALLRAGRCDRLTAQEVSWTTASREGAALWALPGRWRETRVEALRLTLRTAPAVGLRAGRVLRGLAKVEARAADRHLYLAVLGVDPDARAQGSARCSSRRGSSSATARACPPTWRPPRSATSRSTHATVFVTPAS